MKTFSFFITLLLTLAWGYTSWYWYTCNIKGFCNGNTPVVSVQEGDISGGDENEAFSENSNAQKLSAGDVLLEGETPRSDSQDTATGSQDIVAASGELSDPLKENLMKDSQANPIVENTLTLCTGNFVGPIALGAKNDPEQVQLLEKFLISQGNQVQIDGEYTQSDVDAVKKFQLEYKQDILDPWSIAAPTGYVYTTTIKKMKEISCK